MTTKESNSCPLTQERCDELMKKVDKLVEENEKQSKYLFAGKAVFWTIAFIAGLFAWFFDHAAAIKEAINGWLDTTEKES